MGVFLQLHQNLWNLKGEVGEKQEAQSPLSLTQNERHTPSVPLLWVESGLFLPCE